jgi:hydrogenase maturation protease
MPEKLVIAYGNPLRCDDGVAWHVGRALADLHFPDVEILISHQLTPEMALSVSRAGHVLFIDATGKGQPGEITAAIIKPQTDSSFFTHDFSPGTILGLTNELYGKRPTAMLLSICGENFDHGDQLSSPMREALPRLIAEAKRLLHSGPR